MGVDFGKTADDYAAHRAGFPRALFARLAAMGIGRSGQRLLDLGTGTGTLARGFARRGAKVTGIDPAEPMLRKARRLSQDEGVQVDYRVGRAEDIDSPDGAYDVVTAGQCWHWFDRVAAASECMRVLAPGGALCVCYFDWLPMPGNVVTATESLILQHNPGWSFAGGLGMYPLWTLDVAAAGFLALETFSFDVEVPYRHDAWRGRIRASAGVAASLPPDAVAAFDAELADLLARDFPHEPLAVPHRVWALVARKPNSSP
ncbi:MAG TPA: class I SAM-dependent methyltransferase [Acidimicrobiales bacterium]|nr:class I SAM-dependent methyltransferase [Acidimicrobiales bacterium]